MNLRIISGKLKSRLIKCPDLEITRPTTDRIREAVFSSIQFEIENSICLDLFAGSAAWSLEAVSRGATKVIANELNPNVYKIAKENIETMKVNNIDLYNLDAVKLLKSKNKTEYDFIFLDPPYDKIDLVNDSIQVINEQKMLKKYGYIILETNNPNLIKIPKGYIIQKEKQYGKTSILYIVNQ